MNHRTKEDRTIGADDRAPTVHGTWASGLVAVLGLSLGIWAVLGDASGLGFWNDVAVGAVLTVAGGSNFVRRRNGRPGGYWAAVVAVVAGMWLVASPFVLDGLPGPAGGAVSLENWVDLFVGMLAVILSTYSAYEAGQDRNRGASR